MNQKLVEITSKLKEELNNHPDVIELERLSKLLSENENNLERIFSKNDC